MGKLINGIFKKKNIAYMIIALGLYSITPFIIISQYNHPSSDDFGLGLSKEKLIPNIVKTYEHRNGRYFQTISARLNPLRYHSFRMYKVLPIILLCLFTVAMISFIYYFLRKYYTFKHIFAISSLFIFLFLLQMPSTSEGFFWFSGYVTYLIPTILTLFLIPIIFIAIETNSRLQKIVLLFASSILCAAIIGSNEISLFILDSTILFLFVNQLLKSRAINKILFGLLILCLTLSVIEIIAPGNYVRIDSSSFSENLIWTIFGSLSLTITEFIKWSIPLLIASIFYTLQWGTPLTKKLSARKDFSNINFNLSIIFYLGIIYLSNFIHVFLTGYNPSYRVQNIIYLFFILGWFMNLQLYLNKQNKSWFVIQTGISKIFLITSVLLLFLLSFQLDKNISTVYIDLITGKAKAYDRELTNRYQQINICKTDSCEVIFLSNIPKTIFFSDIKDISHGGIKNKGYSKYFNKSYIYLSSETPEIKSNHLTLKEFGKKERRKWFDSHKVVGNSY